MAPFLLEFLRSQWFVTPPYPKDSFSDKVVVVTGANSGLGREAARHIVRLGASKVIIAGRSSSALKQAREDIIASTHCADSVVEAWMLDLCNYESVKAFAKKAETELSRLDVLLENAGIMTQKFKLAEQDESTITTNVISTFLLGLLLLPKLKETASKYNTRPHLTIVSSGVHFYTTISSERKALLQGKYKSLFEALSDPKTANMSDRYFASKLLGVFAVREMVRTSAPSGYPVIINFVNPGYCTSGLAREMKLTAAVANVILHARSTEVGSRTLVHAVTAGQESHGEYLDDCEVKPVASFVTSNEGKEVQKRVWKELEEKLKAIAPGIWENL